MHLVGSVFQVLFERFHQASVLRRFCFGHFDTLAIILGYQLPVLAQISNFANVADDGYMLADCLVSSIY